MDEIESITTAVLAGAARGDLLHPLALTFLLRRYRATGRSDVAEVVGEALAVALARQTADETPIERAAWLRALTEAASMSDDARLADAARELIEGLAAEWPSAMLVDGAAACVEACLFASHLVDPHDLIPRAIDELERIVGGAYRPGHGIAHRIGSSPHVRGGALDHVRAASALLTAFELTGRLPYSMLAEELMQASREDISAGGAVGPGCEAARVLCRLAILHDDEAYRAAAVIAADADYRAEAGRLLSQISTGVRNASPDAALYGLALDEWLAIRHRSS